MNKKLILTGWSKNEYLAGAAAALAALNGNADIAGVSMEALAGVLAERGPNYSAVYVLGVGLTKNIQQILAALKSLKKKRVKTVWLSGMRVAPEFAAEVCIEGEDPAKRGFDELFDEPCDSFVDAIARYFGTIDEDDVRFLRSYEHPAEDRSSSVGMYQTLVNVSGYMHRTRGDDSIYEAAIRALYMRVKPAMWETKLREAFEDYNRYGRRELAGVSKAMAKVRHEILQAAKYVRARVLILGESGTGKETVATQIHAHSPRKDGPFVPFNCASVAPNLLEDRFFGHERGAFTSADSQRKGLFEMSDRGTLFLDEIAEMPMEAQAILLRALEDGKIVRVGGTHEISVDVRLVAATNRNLPKMVREGRFRADLYQRISTIVINVPPLRDRREDIAEIASGFWLDMGWGRLAREQCDALSTYDYPGNVRELINILDRARALEETDFAHLMEEHVRINRDLGVSDGETGMPENLDAAIKVHVKAVFARHGHNLAETCKALGISLNTLKKYLRT